MTTNNQDEIRDMYMAEFQDLHDTQGCQYRDRIYELEQQFQTANKALQEINRYASLCHTLNFIMDETYIAQLIERALSNVPTE